MDGDVDCKNDKTSNIRIDLVDSSPFHLKGSFPGPEDTPYQGGLFEVVRLHPITTLMYHDAPHRTSSSPNPTPSSPSK